MPWFTHVLALSRLRRLLDADAYFRSGIVCCSVDLNSSLRTAVGERRCFEKLQQYSIINITFLYPYVEMKDF